ncbi:MAG: DUF1570 domain-containing protein [Pirellulales bacterium]|nr:DUF1570 domain-containing protein [Pirellulales bacterium]
MRFPGLRLRTPVLVRWRHLGVALALVCLAPVARAQGLSPVAEGGDEEKPVAGERRPAPQAEPDSLSQLLASGAEVRPGGGELLYVRDENGKALVSRLHCAIGDQCLVLLPDGKLNLVPRVDTRPSNKPFQAADAQTMMARLRTGKFSSFKTAASEHYLYVYSCSEQFYQSTRDILESLYPGVIARLEQWDLQPTAPSVPLVVMIFPNRQEFDALKPMPPEVAAYYSGLSNHIVLYEDPLLSDRAPEFALKEASYTIAHEGVHQILHNVGIQQRLSGWPAWLGEGLPEYFCPINVSSVVVNEQGAALPQRNLKWTRAGLVNDLRMAALLKMSSKSGDAIQRIVNAPQLDADGYALAWGLTHYLAEKAKKPFGAYLQEISRMGPLERQEGEDSLFTKHFGSDFAALETAVQRHLTSGEIQKSYRDPMIYQTHYVVVHTTKRGRTATVSVAITLSPGRAREWKEQEEKEQATSDPGTIHAFRTQVCKTRIEAEQIVKKIGR